MVRSFYLILALLMLHNPVLGQKESRWIIVNLPVSNHLKDPHRIQMNRILVDEAKEAGFLDSLQRLHEDVLIERDFEVNALLIPNDPSLAKQWHLRNPQGGKLPFAADIQSSLAWEIETGSKDVVVGVLDSGIDWQHPDLVNNIWQNLAEDADGDGHVLEWNGSQWIFDPGDENGLDDDGNGYVDDFIGWDFVNNDNNPMDDHIFGHGTHVGGIIGAEGNNQTGVSGIAWEVQLMPLKFLNAQGRGFISNAIEAMDYAINNGAQLSNHSWGSPQLSQAFEMIINRARQNNHLLVAAAGNNYGNDNDIAPIFPASYDASNLIAVGSSNLLDSLAAFSNVGLNSVDLFAPGLGIFSTLPNESYGYLSGTSMSAPMVSGGLSLLLSQSPNMDITELKERISRSVTPIPFLEGKCVSGGRLNLFQLLNRPILFNMEESWKILDVCAGSNGNWFELGKNEDILLVSRNNRGQQDWVQKLGDSTLSCLAYHPKLGAMLSGISSDSKQLRVIRMREDGTLNWERSWFLPSKLSLMGSLALHDQFIIWGQAAPDSIWMASMDSLGNFYWNKVFDLSTNGQINNVSLSTDGDVLCLIGSGNSDFYVMSLNSAGSIKKGISFQLPGNQNANPLLVKGSEEEWGIIYKSIAGQNTQLVSFQWELDDAEGEEGFSFETNGPAAFSLAEGPEDYIIMSGKTSTDNFLATFRSNSLVSSSSFKQGVGLLNPQKIIWNQGVGAFFQAPNQPRSVFLKSDLGSRILCNDSSFSLNFRSQPLPTHQTFNPNSQNQAFQSLRTNLPISPDSITEVFICDNGNCSTRAFFSVESLIQCPEAILNPQNLSTNALRYSWYMDGALLSTQANPSLMIPEDDGFYRLRLEAENGSCVDTFGLLIQVVPLPDLDNIDSTHCGPNFKISSPIVSPIYQYLWMDENGIPLGTDPEIRLDTSGVYELVIANPCGETAEMEVSLTLQNGCVWPGDANTDGEVNMDDYLLMATIQGTSGPTRPNASSQYRPQTGPDWVQTFPNNHGLAPAVNYKHADADGNGIIELAIDGAIVKQNFTKPASSIYDDSSKVEVSLEFNTNLIALGDTGLFSVNISRSDSQDIQDIYGLSLALAYNTPLSAPIQVQTGNSFLNGVTGTDSLRVSSNSNRRLNLGITRFDQNGINGRGAAIGGGITIFIDDIGTGTSFSGNSFFTMALADVKLIRPDGSLIPVNTFSTLGNQTLVISDSVGTATSIEGSFPTESMASWKIGPNPSRGFLSIYGQKNQALIDGLHIQLIDLQGRIVYQTSIDSNPINNRINLVFPPDVQGYFWIKLMQKNDVFVAPVRIDQ
ncbi:MAG: S8 family serine peptidase [Bacteroidia bacterium]|nr:S8 family serine peptidase [Bacteroidia bacterium]